MLPEVYFDGNAADIKVNNVQLTVVDPGDGSPVQNVENTFSSGIGLSYYDLFNPSYNVPSGIPQIFELIFPANVNAFAVSIAAAINNNYDGQLFATAAGNVVSIAEIPASPVSSINFFSFASLTKDAQHYCTLTTVANSISPNAMCVNLPVLGKLIKIQNNQAYISTANVQSVTLSGNNNVIINPVGNDLNADVIISRLCILDNNGGVESVGSWDYLRNTLYPNIDVRSALELTSSGCLYWALSAGNVGDTILVTSSVPISLLLAGLFKIVTSGTSLTI